MMANRVQYYSYEVGSVILRWYIGKGKGLADEMFSYKVVGNISVLGSMIVVWVLSNIDGGHIICHNCYVNTVSELSECIEVRDSLMRCSGNCHIFYLCGARGNRLLFLREPGYTKTISHKSII